MEHLIEYDFYCRDYADTEFDDKLRARIRAIRDRYRIGSDDDRLVGDYFVEVFSWSVFPRSVLHQLGKHIARHNLSGAIDPCCGNAFHTYLLRRFLQLETHSVDIQGEPMAWTDVTEMDGRLFLETLGDDEHQRNALLLSWIDYDSLAGELLNRYRGSMVISVGNYDRTSPGYIEQLQRDFSRIDTCLLKMPWGLTEKIEIYVRKPPSAQCDRRPESVPLR